MPRSVTRRAKRATSLKDLVPTFLSMLNIVKVYHWNTQNYATHKATDELYGELNQKIDDFIEVLLGKTARPLVLGTMAPLPITTFKNNATFKKYIEQHKAYLISFTSSPMFRGPEHTDLLNIRDEILGILNQFLYLLTLS